MTARYRVCHTRFVKRYAWFTAGYEADAIDQAREVDENESDWEGWDTDDSDPGNFEVLESQPQS